MSEELHQQIRHMLEEVETLAPPRDLPAAGQVWSRLKFRLAYHPRGESFSQPSIVLIAVYLFVFLMWITWWKWLSASLVVVLMFAAAAAIFLCLQISQEFRS